MRQLRLPLMTLGLLFATSFHSVHAAPVVSNVRASQRTDGTGLVDVYYDLSGATSNVYVDVVFSNDDGQHWNVIPTPNLISGDTGFAVPNGNDRHIVWDAGRDRVLVYWPQTKAKVRASETGQTITLQLPGGIPLQMVRIPPGSFVMGSGLDPGYSVADESPQHTVTFNYEFFIGRYEVTQQQWYAVMGSNPSNYVGITKPVNYVTWTDCQNFITALNALGLGTFRLPSESEWEYACRAGSTTRFYFGDDPANLGTYAWFSENSSSTTHPVGEKLPNAFGLYDVSGNVWEWCQDWYHNNYTGAPTDGSAWESPTSSYRVARGGAFNSSATMCRSAGERREYYPSTNRSTIFGLRVVRIP